MNLRTAIIPAAGFSSRFLPATKAIPKAMLPIVDKPIIEFIIDEAIDSGIEKIVIVIGRHGDVIVNHFSFDQQLETKLNNSNREIFADKINRFSNRVEIVFVEQKEPLGLGHAILMAESEIKENCFAVLLVDELIYHEKKPAIGQLMCVYDEIKAPLLGVYDVPLETASNYGIVSGTESGNGLIAVSELIEKPQKPSSTQAVIGRYIFTTDIFDGLKQTTPGMDGEIHLIDALNVLKTPVFAKHIEGDRYDVGQPLGYMQASLKHALMRDDIANAIKHVLDQ